MMNGKACIFCFCVLFVAFSLAAYGSEGIQAGPLKIKPSIENTVSSDNNVLLGPSGTEEDDMFYTAYPRVIMDMPYAGHSFMLDYGIRLRRYSDFDSEDNDLQNLEFDGMINVNSELSFRVMDRYRELSGDTEEILGRVEYSRNTAEVRGMYELNSQFSFEGFYTSENYDYEDVTLIGRSESVYGGVVIYNLYEKWAFLGEVAHGEVDIDDTASDASFNRLLVGARGSFTPKITGKVRLGFESRSYDGDRTDTDLGYLAGDVIYEIASDTKLLAGMSRELIESITFDDNAYTATQLRCKVTKDFADRISVILSGYYQSNDYEEMVPRGGVLAERKDDIWQAQVGVEYRLNRWTVLLANLEHKDFDSSLDENDYDFNRINVGARLEY